MIDGKALEAWFKKRPKWLQEAALRLLQHGKLDKSNIQDLVNLCKLEAVNGNQSIKVDIPTNALIRNDVSVEFRLNAIADINGINALTPRNPLKFDNGNLTIIYGPNGSGKSGYVRILKHACGARHLGNIHSDISKPPVISQGCKFNYTVDGEIKELIWKVADSIHPEFNVIEIYDTRCGEVYVNESNEVSFEPGLLAFFQKLADVCDSVANELNAELLLNCSVKPILPSKFAKTEAEKWYQQLNRTTSNEAIEKWCGWSETDECDLIDLRKRLSEQDPSAKAATLRRQKTNLMSLIDDLGRMVEQLSPGICNVIIELRNAAHVKRQVADVDAKNVFAGISLAGIGSESWKQLWEQARRFSEVEAYPGVKFPNTENGARCVLCHHELAHDDKARLVSFEEFVKGALEQEAKTAERNFENLIKKLPEVPTIEKIKRDLDSTGLAPGVLSENVINLRAAIEKRKTNLLGGRETEAFQNALDKETITQLQQFASVLERDAEICLADAAADKRLELERITNENEARKWLSQQKDAIENEIKRLQKNAILDRAKLLTNTSPLTKKKVELSGKLVTAEYIKRFEAECKELKASKIDIEIAPAKGSKGRVLHQIRLRKNKNDVPTGEVLSEGELRVISLAAFLADAEGRKEKTPIIFDDPISSLDQVYEEAMGARLVKLSRNRQVIVFTHRISLLVLLQDAANKDGFEPDIKALERQFWSAGECGVIPFEAQKTKSALNTLIDEVEKGRKILETDGIASYDIRAQDICSKFRKLLERIVEEDLLVGIIKRFRRSVQTMNKLDKLVRISHSDTKFLDDMMTKYSSYEHSQPIEAPVRLPDPDELKIDIEALKNWRDAFKVKI